MLKVRTEIKEVWADPLCMLKTNKWSPNACGEDGGVLKWDSKYTHK
jgi:hypothetical protein